MKNINENNVTLHTHGYRRLSLITNRKLIVIILLLTVIIPYSFIIMKASTDPKTLNSDFPKTSDETLLDGCRFIYIDMGTNIGIQIRKLYEPNLYPSALILPIFKEYFGDHLNEVCAVGFEGNPVHNKFLKEFESYCLKRNWRVKIFTSTAVSIKQENVTYYTEPENVLGKQGGSGLIAGSKTASVTVQSVDMSSWIKKTVMNRKIPSGLPSPKIVMKSDIEGHDPTVIANLIFNGVFCSIDLIYAEHFNNEFHTAISVLQRNSGLCKTKFIYLDDETYFNHTPPYIIPKSTK
jgi:hypothetical protein